MSDEMRYLVVPFDSVWSELIEYFDRRGADLMPMPKMDDDEDGAYYIITPRVMLRGEHLCWDGHVRDGLREQCCVKKWEAGEALVDLLLTERP